MNENRSVFALDGITGMLIATVLLLTILVGLTVWGMSVQNANMTKYYEIQDADKIEMISKDNANHWHDVK